MPVADADITLFTGKTVIQLLSIHKELLIHYLHLQKDKTKLSCILESEMKPRRGSPVDNRPATN